MSRLLNPASTNPALAQALGRFSQSCVYLERRVEEALYTLLPVTMEMGRVLFAGNQLRRNIDIIRALTRLRDVPLEAETRETIRALCNEAAALNDERSRLLHHPIIEGPPGPGQFHLVQHKSDGKNTAAMPITIAQIVGMAERAEELAWRMMAATPNLEYDTSQWVRSFPSYPVKRYPTNDPPSPKRPRDRRRSRRQNKESH